MIASQKSKRLYETFSGAKYSVPNSKFNFSILVKLLKSIQKQGKIPRLSQIEDLLPLQIYIHRSSTCCSFQGKGLGLKLDYCHEAERIGLVHLEYDEQVKTILEGNKRRDGNIILLRPLDLPQPEYSIKNSIYSTIKGAFESFSNIESCNHLLFGLLQCNEFSGNDYGYKPIESELY